MAQKVLAYDLGGTKVAVGVVDSTGEIHAQVRTPVLLEKGKPAVLRQLADLGRALLLEFPEVKKAGLASAGPLDPEQGLLLDPTNFAAPDGTRWGRVPIARILAQSLGIPVRLENDAAAAILAEHWIGSARGKDNAMILTLGTGLGTGIIANGELVRAGRHLHPEAGHLILRAGDKSAPCGCGNFGCAEAYLSGMNFARRANAVFLKTRKRSAPHSSREIAELARSGNKRALEAFAEYSWLLAVALHNFAVIYSPETVVFTGGFADASDLFLPAAKKHLDSLLKQRNVGMNLTPKLKLSALGNDAGILGGAYIGFFGSQAGAKKS